MTSLFRSPIWLIGLLWLGLLSPLRAQGPAMPTVATDDEELPLLTDYPSFWGLPESARQQRFRINYEATVLFYDAEWGVLWLQNQGTQFFCKPGPSPWPIRTGQLVRVEGVVVPANGYQIEGLRFTALGPSTQPPPLTFDGRGDIDSFNERRVCVRGYVERMTEAGATHVQLRLIADGHAINAILSTGDSEAVPQFVGSTVEIVGLFARQQDPGGNTQSLDLWAGEIGGIKVIGSLLSDPRFLEPVVSSSSLWEHAPTGLIRVSGTVRSATAGRSLTLWDDTGEITVYSGQDTPIAPGTAVEAIGIPEVSGTDLSLRHALWRPTTANSPAPAPLLRKLRRAAQVLELSPEAAQLQYPVKLSGVITWWDPAATFFYLQDSTRGVCVRISESWAREPPKVGTSARIEGHTAMGAFAPVVQLEHLELITGIVLPKPREIGFDQVLGGAEEGKFVELHGYLRSVETIAPWTRLHLTSPSGEFTARMPADPELKRLTGSVVRLNGVCTALANDRRQLTGIELLVASAAEITVEEPAQTDPFAVPAVGLSDLRLFGPLQTPYRRIRTSGKVTFHDPGRLLLIEDDGDGLEILARDPTPLEPDTTVEVVGFPGRQGSQLVLREAIFRELPTTPGDPAPRALYSLAELRPEKHNRLVWTNGQLLGQVRLGEQHQLTLQADALTFTVLLPASVPLPRLALGSELRCTGVYRTILDEYGQAREFQLLARTAADIVVVQQPPWLNRGRAVLLAALLAIGIAVAFTWNLLLRRRVRTQTSQIRRQLEQQTAMERELQKAAKLESLGLLAGGIAHDFNNLLTVILGNITLARLDDQVEASVGDCLGDAERGAQRARDLTQQLLTFAKGGDPLRTAVSLSEIVRESAEFVLRGSNVACDFAFAPGLRVAEVDRGQIGQVVHNLALNAKQAMPDGGTIRIALNNTTVPMGSPLPLNPGHYLELTIADTGTGMSPEVLARVFDPYFTTKTTGNGLGLATVYSIIRRHHGHIEARSERGRGTAFHLWLPAGTAAPATASETVPHALPNIPSGRRVLIMDDEEDIRRLMTTLLVRMGLKVVATADGAAAIAAYRAAHNTGTPFNLVIMDLTVPGGMGGKEAMDALLAFDPAVCAIVSSGYSNDPVLANCRAFGFRAMVRKPYDIEELANCVARVLAEAAAAGPPSTS